MSIVLDYETYEDALVVPSASRSVMRGIDGAAFDAAGRPIMLSLLTRTWERGQISVPPDISDLSEVDIETVDEPHIYGGYFFDHFGHFLLETLARAWVVEEVGRKPFVWASGSLSAGWQAEILSILGLEMEQRFPTRPTRFRKLIVPRPGFRIQGEIHPRHAAFLGRYAPPSAPAATQALPKIWLSRTGTSDGSSGEKQLQELLRRRGWRISHPETMSVRAQLDALAGAQVVAGLEGSAFHSVLLLQAPPAPLVVLRRSANANYRAIAECKGAVEHDLYGAFRIQNRRYRALAAPLRWGRIVDDLAVRVASAENPAALLALRAEYESRYPLVKWLARQRWRVVSQAYAGTKAMHHRLRRRIRRRVNAMRA